MSIKLNIRYSLLCLVLFFATGSLAYAQQAQDRKTIKVTDGQLYASPEGPLVTGHENETDLRLTQKGNGVLYASAMRWNGKPFYIHHLKDKEVEKVVCLATGKDVDFEQTDKGLLVNASLAVAEPSVTFKIVLKSKGKRVLFIGDSITDGGWGRSGGSMKPSNERNHTDLNHLYGHSFMMLCASHLESEHPDAAWQFYNRGISGNTLAHLAERWHSDAMSLKPEVVTILVGINDVYEFMKTKKSNPDSTFDFTSWEKQYRSLLDSLRCGNSNIKIMIGAPFISNDGKNGKLSNYAEYDSIVSQLAAITKSIAHDYDATFLPFNSMFAQLIAQQPRPGYWIWDGIHPTPAGHRRMADMWIKAFEETAKK